MKMEELNDQPNEEKPLGEALIESLTELRDKLRSMNPDEIDRWIDDGGKP